jgi:hypothetical protein
MCLAMECDITAHAASFLSEQWLRVTGEVNLFHLLFYVNWDEGHFVVLMNKRSVVNAEYSRSSFLYKSLRLWRILAT